MSSAHSRPVVTVHSAAKENEAAAGSVALPAVFRAPIRPDVVRFVHTNVAKNQRQAYSVSSYGGTQTSAISWGTGRAVARIPRVPGGGTHRAGQGAFGNMCRGGRMFAPTKVWRKWHHHVNQNQRRYATTSALAASALPSLLLARGHKISSVPEVPLVVSNGIESVTKTKQAVDILRKIHAFEDAEWARESRQLRKGAGKQRNRRHVQRRGPLVIYNEDNGITQAFRNLPGVELANVNRLGLLQLAPGGHLGRFIIWSQGAFEKLNALYGTWKRASSIKSDYNLPQHSLANSDLARLINSDEIQSVVRPAQPKSRRAPIKKNPLKNLSTLIKLNPYAAVARRTEIVNSKKQQQARAALIEKHRAAGPNAKTNDDKTRKERVLRRKNSKAFGKTLLADD